MAANHPSGARPGSRPNPARPTVALLRDNLPLGSVDQVPRSHVGARCLVAGVRRTDLVRLFVRRSTVVADACRKRQAGETVDIEPPRNDPPADPRVVAD